MAPSDTSRSLLLEHCDRSATGRTSDPATVAAVVGIERIACAAGTTDPSTLRGLLTRSETTTPELDLLVTEVLDGVAAARARRDLGWPTDASVVNSEAGAHPVASNLGALRAGVRAAHATFAAVPYYQDRYGRRGTRFAASDSSFIVHLLPASTTVATRQVTWLGELLAAKGMPTWLMELHLGELVDQLEAAGLDAGPLPHAAGVLAGRRREHVDDDLLESAEQWVRADLAAPPTAPTGRLLAAAFADVGSGAARDDAALLDWLVDPGRTSRSDAAALLAVRARIMAATSRRAAPVVVAD